MEDKENEEKDEEEEGTDEEAMKMDERGRGSDGGEERG